MHINIIICQKPNYWSIAIVTLSHMQTILQPKSLTIGPPRIRHAQLPKKIANIVFDT